MKTLSVRKTSYQILLQCLAEVSVFYTFNCVHFTFYLVIGDKRFDHNPRPSQLLNAILT